MYIFYGCPFPCGFGHYKARDPAMYNDQGSFSFLSEHRSSSVRRSSGRHTQHHSSSETTMATTRPACVPSVYVYLFRCVAHGHYSYSKAFLTDAYAEQCFPQKPHSSPLFNGTRTRSLLHAIREIPYGTK